MQNLIPKPCCWAKLQQLYCIWFFQDLVFSIGVSIVCLFLHECGDLCEPEASQSDSEKQKKLLRELEFPILPKLVVFRRQMV